MKLPSRNPANRKPPAPTAGTGAAEERPRRYRGRDLPIKATPEQLAAVIGAGPPKAPHEWNYPNGRPAQSPVDMLHSRRSATSERQGMLLGSVGQLPERSTPPRTRS